MITRRTFLGHLGAQAAAAGILNNMAFAKTIDKLGVQLYTVRDLMGKDFEGTLAKVAGAGYKEVEFAGYFDKKPQDVVKEVAV